MECDKNGRKRNISAETRRGVKRKCRSGGAGGLQLAYPPAVSDEAPALPMRVNLVPHCPPESMSTEVNPDAPFMNNMDEISYWIYTKRAPCLFHYDNDVKRQVEQAHCSKTKPTSVQSACDDVPSPKKKKRKLKLLDDDSSSEKQQNVYFETSQNQKPVASKSDEASNVDFNIKNSPQNTSKRMKLQRNCQTSQKKNKVVTSTPKVTNLRRSLRKAQQNHNNSQLNTSFEIFNSSVHNGKGEDEHKVEPPQGSSGDQLDQNRSKVADKKKNVLNGQFEDLSDVSGFTANYIRSTKIHSSKTPRKLRNRNSRSLVKDTKNVSTEEKIVVCVNKSVNVVPDAVLNCSTDSSQNVLNLVTVKDGDKHNKNNKSTSLLKFMDSKVDKTQQKDKRGKGNLNISFQSKSSGNSRYPKRHKNRKHEEQTCSNANTTPAVRHSTRKSKINDSNRRENSRKENSDKKVLTRTRSGRKINVKLEFNETGCVLNNSSELSSSALNVASTKRARPNTSSTRCLRSRRDKSGHLGKDSTSESDKKAKKTVDKSMRRDSLRDKSGFAACFSDSDSDSEPLFQKKFFC